MKDIIDYLHDKNIHVAQVNLLPITTPVSSKYEKIGKVYEVGSPCTK